MTWLYFIIITAVAHFFCAALLLLKSQSMKWAIKGLFFGLIAVYLYKKNPDRA